MIIGINVLLSTCTNILFFTGFDAPPGTEDNDNVRKLVELVKDAVEPETSSDGTDVVTTATKRKHQDDAASELPAVTPKKKGLELVREKGHEDIFVYLLEHCYGMTLQRHIWLRGLRNSELHEVISAYDEALVLLLLENNLLMWQDMSLKKTLKPKECTVAPVYTTSRGKGVGWSWRGIARFNALLKTVELQRKRKQMADLELNFVAKYRNKKAVNRGSEMGVGLRTEKMLLEEEEPMFAVPDGNKRDTA